MKLFDYINDCLKNPEFKKYWEEEDFSFLTETFVDNSSISIQEALKLLNEIDLDNILKNKGIKANIDIGTTIEFFEYNGKCPVRDFIQEIKNEKLKVKTLKNILLLAKEGNAAKNPLSSFVGDGIFELRTKQSSNITRIFYFFVFGNKIIMTNGYIKKSQNMDENEFQRAKKYMNDYLGRK